MRFADIQLHCWLNYKALFKITLMSTNITRKGNCSGQALFKVSSDHTANHAWCGKWMLLTKCEALYNWFKNDKNMQNYVHHVIITHVHCDREHYERHVQNRWKITAANYRAGKISMHIFSWTIQLHVINGDVAEISYTRWHIMLHVQINN